MAILYLRCFHFLLPQIFFLFLIFFLLRTTIPVLPSSSSALKKFYSFFSPSLHPVTLNRSSDTYSRLLAFPTYSFSVSFTSLKESQGHDCYCCSYLKQHCIFFLILLPQQFHLFCPLDLRPWVTKCPFEIFCNSTVGLTFLEVFRENSHICP